MFPTKSTMPTLESQGQGAHLSHQTHKIVGVFWFYLFIF